jgi:hypothetical protein
MEQRHDLIYHEECALERAAPDCGSHGVVPKCYFFSIAVFFRL